MASINPYLNFNGATEEAFNLYKSVFGGEFITLQRFKDAPPMPGASEKDNDKIMHISLPIGKSNILMGSDTVDSHQQKLVAGNNFYISVQADSKKDADKFFNGLTAGGKVEMPMQDTFWGAYFGMLADRFGVHWMISYEANPPK